MQEVVTKSDEEKVFKMLKELTKKFYSLKSLSDVFAEKGKENFQSVFEFINHRVSKVNFNFKKKRLLTFQCSDKEETGRSGKRSHALKPFSLPEN